MRTLNLGRGPRPTARIRGSTALWGVVGLLCSLGVILALLDPSLTGRASGGMLGQSPHSAVHDDDDGFVAPPTLERADETAVEATPRASEQAFDPRGGLPEDWSTRQARADQLIDKLIVKLRAERAAEKAARQREAGK